MKIVLEYVAMLHLDNVVNGGELELPEGTRVAGLLEHLRIPAAHRATVAVFVNDQRARASGPLSGGDRVFLGLPIGGG